MNKNQTNKAAADYSLATFIEVRFKLELTPLELLVLQQNWNANLSYGSGGTFGDGEKINTREFNIGKRIAKKLESLREGKAVQP